MVKKLQIKINCRRPAEKHRRQTSNYEILFDSLLPFTESKPQISKQAKNWLFVLRYEKNIKQKDRRMIWRRIKKSELRNDNDRL